MHVYLPVGARYAQVPFCSQGRGAQTGEDCTELVGAGSPTQVLAMSWPSFCLQQALREAQDDLEITQRILEEAKQHLREVEDGIATMQAKYRECVAKKEELEMKCEQCEQRLSRADKVRALIHRAHRQAHREEEDSVMQSNYGLAPPAPFLAPYGWGHIGQR